MPGHLRLLPVLALLPLPVEVQHHIARTGSVDARRALAASNGADPSVLDRLASDPDRDTHHTALRRSTDQSVLHARLERGTACCATHTLRNPAVDPERLTAALGGDDPRQRLAAYVNPTTPAETRAGLDAAAVTALVDVGEPIGDTVVRSHEAILANRALLSQTASFGPVLRRAAFALADLTAAEYEELTLHGRTGRYGGRHPVARSRSGASVMGVDELLALHSPAADLWLAGSPDTDTDTARRLMTRQGHHVEPHVIARLLTRFGTAFIPSGIEHTIAGTRVASTAWSNPAGRFYNDVVRAKTDASYDELVEAVQVLGDDHGAWVNFLALLADWDGSVRSLATTARSL